MNKKRILIVVYKYFHEDPRPQREAALLIRNGYEIDVICPRPSSEPYIRKDHMRFFCPVISRKRGTKLRYIFEYGVFLAYAFLKTISLQLRNRYSLIQVFVMPEILMLGCIVPKLLGAKILMDWEDPSREVYLAKFEGNRKGLFLALISLFEKISVHVADRIIVPNIGFTKAFVKRGIPEDKIDVVMNGTDSAIFSTPETANEQPDDQGRFVIVYNGAILYRHGLHILIKAMQKVVAGTGPSALLRVIGHGEPRYVNDCKQQIKDAGLSDAVEWVGLVSIKEMPGLIASASVGVIPNLENDFTRINFPQRIFEFAALKKPLVLARMDGIEDYLSQRDVAFFEPGDSDDLASKLIELSQSRERCESVAANLHNACKDLSWEDGYLDIVSELTAHPSV